MTESPHLPDEWQSSRIHQGTPSLQSDADALVRSFEINENMLQYELGSWCAWPLLRFLVIIDLEGLQVKKSVISETLSYSQRLNIALKEIRSYLRLPRSDIICLAQSSNRSEKVGERYKDIYFDDLLSLTGSFLKIENLVNRHYLSRSRQALLPSQLTTIPIQLGIGALLRLPVPPLVKHLSSAISDKVVARLGLAQYTPERIATMLANFTWSKLIYKQIFAHFQPRYLLLTTAYAYFAPVAAAKELGIQVIEFQHGFIGRHHGGYSWTATALPYKKHMPLPDRIFLYGDYWKDILSEHGFWNSDLVPVGSLRMDSYRQRISESQQHEQVNLLVTTQNIDIQPVIDFFTRFCSLAMKEIDYHLTFKLHPGENDKSRYRAAFGQNPHVDILLGSESPSTYELITQADWHISIYSTCHYEALALGKPTVILPFSNHQVVYHLCDGSSAFLSATPEELISLIKNNPKPNISNEIGHHYFKPGALQNMLHELSL